MRINRVKAKAFGPLQNEELEFQEGMTVVAGGNEAGKSSWVAAIYAALCGRRQGTGGIRTDDKRFMEQHRPWDSDDDWEVSCEVTLDSGDTLEIRHELLKHSSCHVVNSVTGQDVSTEHMNENCPDGSRLLGLTRDIMWATLFARQASVIDDLNNPVGLQNALQCAADAGREKTTATQAIEKLKKHLSEQIGSDRAPTKPLVIARREVAAAKDRLDKARSKNEELDEIRENRDELDGEIDDLNGKVRLLKAREASQTLTDLNKRLDAVNDLQNRYPSLTAPPTSSELDDRIDLAQRAIAEWNAAPEPAALPDGSSAVEIEQAISHLDEDPEKPALEPAVPAQTAVPWAKWMLATGVLLIVVSIGTLATDVGVIGISLLAIGLLATVLGAVPMIMRTTPPTAVERQVRPEASLRQDLADKLEMRRQLERQHDSAVKVRMEAEGSLMKSCKAIGVPTEEEPDVLAVQLHEHLEAWRSLQSHLAGRTEAELRKERDDTQALLEELGGVPTLPPSDDLSIDALKAQLHEKYNERERLKGQLDTKEADIPDLARLEERVEEWEAKLNRIEFESSVVKKAIAFMDDAQTEVYAAIAPNLKNAVEPQIARVTGGRYTSVGVCSEDLAVTVKTPDGMWKSAELMSQGTAEQMHLILRLAIAEQLTQEGESGFLVLDDVTVHSDDSRTIEFLEILHKVSESRQVILFTQEEEVEEWARKHLAGPRDALVELALPAVDG